MTVQSAAQTDRAGTMKVLITVASLHGATDEIATALGEEHATLRIFRGLDGDFRDWSAIREWGRGIAQELTPVSR